MLISYLKNLREYFESFFRRARPLTSLAELKREAEEEFNEQWKAGTFPGWDHQRDKLNDAEQDALFCPACNYNY
jgi:hypothetical protein